MTEQSDCEQIYQMVLAPDDQSKDSLFRLAQCFIDGFAPAKLRAMLVSEDDGIVSDGLFVLGEVGRDLASRFSVEVSRLTAHADIYIRRDAEAFMRGWQEGRAPTN